MSKCVCTSCWEGRADYHQLSRSSFLCLVKEQLSRSLDQDFGPLGPQGARGAIFWLRLRSHGYILVAKGTRDVFQQDLLHEAQMYGHLLDLQGRQVPVCLGLVDLEYPYWFQMVPFQHFLLLSWGGVSLCSAVVAEQMREEGQDREYWPSLL